MTTAQLLTLNNNILITNAASLQVFVDAIDDQSIAAWYNTLASPAFYGWRSSVPINDILDKILWANFTPTDAPDTTAQWTNRSLACQGKQFNLQTLVLGKTSLDATRANLRAGLQDALTGLPSGVSGAVLGGGWAAVQLILSRAAMRIEKLFATGTGTQAAPALFVVEGLLDYLDVARALRGVGV